MNQLNKIINSSIVVGSAIGLTITINDVYNIIGLVVLAIQLILVIIQGSLKVIQAMKENDSKKSIDAINETKEELNKYKDGLTNDKEWFS